MMQDFHHRRYINPSFEIFSNFYFSILIFEFIFLISEMSGASISPCCKFSNIRSWPLFTKGQFQYVAQVSTFEGKPFMMIGRYWRPNTGVGFIPTKKNITLPVEAVSALQHILPDINSLLFTLSTPFMQAKAQEQSAGKGSDIVYIC